MSIDEASPSPLSEGIEDDEEESDDNGHNQKSERNFFLDLKKEGIDLNTYEGQNKLVIACQTAILTQGLTYLDMKAIGMVKDLIKTKKDMDVLKKFVELQAEIQLLKEKIVIK